MVWLPSPAAALDHGVVVSDAWIREAPPGVAMLAGYFNLANSSGEPRVLVGAESACFEVVEMHQTRHDGGVARMRRLERVELGAGERVAFEPGGRHLMLIEPRRALRAGDTVPMTLLLGGGEAVEAQFTVRRP